MTPPVIHIVDDDASFRSAVTRVLRHSGYEVETYESAQQLLDHLPDNAAPGCILLDVRIPGVSGPDLHDQLLALGSSVPVIFLTGFGDIPTSVRAIKGGAQDFLTKPVPRATLLDAVERALSRQHQTIEHAHALSAMRALLARLTPREREVFDHVVGGKMNKQIAFALGTTERTVKAHRHRVMEKLKVQSITELVSFAARLNSEDVADQRKRADYLRDRLGRETDPAQRERLQKLVAELDPESGGRADPPPLPAADTIAEKRQPEMAPPHRPRGHTAHKGTPASRQSKSVS